MPPTDGTKFDNSGGGIFDDLSDNLSVEQVIALLEEFGGTRLYIPKIIRPTHALSKALGVEVAEDVAREFGASTMRVPLARAFRARYYRGRGMSFRKIARKLGMTENGVLKLLRSRDEGVSQVTRPARH